MAVGTRVNLEQFEEQGYVAIEGILDPAWTSSR